MILPAGSDGVHAREGMTVDVAEVDVLEVEVVAVVVVEREDEGLEVLEEPVVDKYVRGAVSLAVEEISVVGQESAVIDE
jgi:hypothetical protein